MSLKRADILRFLDTPARERGALFVGHALGDESEGPPQGSLTDAQQQIEEERFALKVKMRDAAARLANALGVEPAPRDTNSIEHMIHTEVYKGFPRRDWHRISIPRDVKLSVEAIETLRDQVKEANRRARVAGFGSSVRRLRQQEEILGDVSDWLTSAFLSVTGATYVTRLSVEFLRITDASLELEAELATGGRATPQQLFSEGYQDLIALLYFLAVARVAGERGQAHILILDDVLQSVDANIRVSLMDLVVREFRDWQLFVTVHDRLWRTQVRDIFQRAGHPVTEVEIRRWDPSGGPVISTTASGEPDASLWAALDGGEPAAICGVAGRLLEQVCDRLSWTIPISVKRRRGDAYTLADLWPGTLKELKGTTAGPAFAAVDKWLHLRNLAGAHYNEWAESVTWAEAEAFGLATLEVFASVRCDVCKGWVERVSAKSYACRCGKTAIAPKTGGRS